MAFPDIPSQVKTMLARPEVRVHHHLWHLVRNAEAWRGLTAGQREQLSDAGWAAPRFEAEPGAGIDFVGMHRQLIDMVNRMLCHIGDANWPSTSAWNPIPWAEDDADWPVPEWPDAHPQAAWARDPGTIADMIGMANDRFRNPDWLRTVSLDQLGTSIEFSIHAWMHLRWSALPPDDPDAEGPENDWLFIPWSSHVNRHYWKLQPWIDARVDDWVNANEQRADLSEAWAGPPRTLPGPHHLPDIELLSVLPNREDVPLAILPKAAIIEGVKDGGTLPWGS